MRAVRGKSIVGKIQGVFSLLSTTFKVYKQIKKKNRIFQSALVVIRQYPLDLRPS
jgi:hypothetical protein